MPPRATNLLTRADGDTTYREWFPYKPFAGAAAPVHPPSSWRKVFVFNRTCDLSKPCRVHNPSYTVEMQQEFAHIPTKKAFLTLVGGKNLNEERFTYHDKDFQGPRGLTREEAYGEGGDELADQTYYNLHCGDAFVMLPAEETTEGNATIERVVMLCTGHTEVHRFQYVGDEIKKHTVKRAQAGDYPNPIVCSETGFVRSRDGTDAAGNRLDDSEHFRHFLSVQKWQRQHWDSTRRKNGKDDNDGWVSESVKDRWVEKEVPIPDILSSRPNTANWDDWYIQVMSDLRKVSWGRFETVPVPHTYPISDEKTQVPSNVPQCSTIMQCLWTWGVTTDWLTAANAEYPESNAPVPASFIDYFRLDGNIFVPSQHHTTRNHLT